MKNPSNGCMQRAYQIAACMIRDLEREMHQFLNSLESDIANLPPVYDAGITPEIEAEHQRIMKQRQLYQKKGWRKK